MKKKLCLLVVVLFLGIIFIKKNMLGNIIKKNNDVVENMQFKISKIIYYSDVNAIENSTTYQNPEWNLDVYQYTDIAIYLGRLSENEDSHNYIKKIFIDNIKISDSKKGNGFLLYLNPVLFGKSEFYIENKIENKLEYNIINSENENNDFSYDIPILFQDLSNPLTVKFVNDEIISNLKIDNSEIVNFDGSLLKKYGIELNDIEKEIKFNINIITQDDFIHKAELELNVPLKKVNKDIYENSIEIEENIDINF